MNELFAILKYRRLALNVLLIFILAAASFYFKPAVPVLFLLTSNFFDILGYHFTLVRKENKLPGKDIVRSYRIIQLMFDVVLLILLGIVFGWIASISGGILKIFALQDILYYFFLKEKLPAKWNWLGFTPLGLFKNNLTSKEVIIQALLGTVLIGFLLFIYR